MIINIFLILMILFMVGLPVVLFLSPYLLEVKYQDKRVKVKENYYIDPKLRGKTGYVEIVWPYINECWIIFDHKIKGLNIQKQGPIPIRFLEIIKEETTK